MTNNTNANKGDQIAYTPEQIERGECVLVLLSKFIRANSHGTGAWPYIVGRAADSYMLGRTISIRGILEDVREMDFSDDAGNKVTVNNDLAAPMARLILKAHPEYAKLMETRKSVFDLLL